LAPSFLNLHFCFQKCDEKGNGGCWRVSVGAIASISRCGLHTSYRLSIVSENRPVPCAIALDQRRYSIQRGGEARQALGAKSIDLIAPPVRRIEPCLPVALPLL